MCCFFVSLIFFGPRLAFLVYWLFVPVKVSAAFANFNLPWLVGILGLIFAPWTALMYVLVFPLNGWDWLWIGLAIGADIFSYVGGYHKRQQVPGYPSDDPLMNY
ncbi:MAG: hypothetical protein ACWGOY_12440 [Anaerolineales bacterium]|jgi:hypothetical protein